MKKTLTVLMMVLLAAMLIISCDSSTSEPETRTPTTIPAPLKKFYTVTFSTGEGGSDVTPQSIQEGKTATKPTDPTKEGYYFVRWSATENGTTAFDFSTKIAKDTTIYAVWAMEYKVGDKGSAGGFIFYDCDADNTTDGGAGADGLKSSDCGWRYLETAPATLSTEYVFGYSRTSETGTNERVGTDTAVGTGKTNTEKLVSSMGDKAYSSSTGSDKATYAAKACSDYTYKGFDDWFLPSKDELNLIYENLCKKKKVSFGNDNYWSSSEVQGYYSYYQDLESGNKNNMDRGTPYYVLPVRAL